MSKEAAIHFELYRHLQNTIDAGAEYHGLRFTDADPERDTKNGYADIVVETDDGDPFLVIEAKREPVDNPDRDIDPYSHVVIEQAVGYATYLGAPYFATYNGQKLVLFKTFDKGVHLLDRKTRDYEVDDISEFAPALLEEVAGVDRDVVEWDPHDATFINRLSSFHSLLQDEFRDSLEETLEDDDFQSQYEKWIGNQGWVEQYEEEPETVHTVYTSQSAYIFMNKLVFYKLLDDAEAYTDVPNFDIDDLVDPATRREAFDELMEAVDFEAIYEQEELFDSLPLTEKAQKEVENLVDELGRYSLEDEFDYDVIGQIYKNIIPAEERHELGQYYTPPRVVDLIVRLTVEEGSSTVFDPACGSGGFLVGAYNRLAELESELEHEEILAQLNGIDINRFPAHLSAINLAVQDLSTQTHDTNIEVEDFFNLSPQQDRVTVERASVDSSNDEDEDGEYEIDVPPTVDSIVANPPYIRSGNIENMERARSHLEGLGYELDRNSDIYCYFFTHSTQFLEDEGRMGFLTSNRWLTSDYGDDLKEFFFDNMKIHAVIDFRQQMFDIPLISTCITILEKCDDPEERSNNRVNLVHVKKKHDTDELVGIVQDDEQDLGTMNIEPEYRRAAFEQSTLEEMERWDRYLFGPKTYFEILSEHGHNLCPLSVLADISRGFTSGNNDYFYFQEKEEYESWGIDERFISPLLKHISPTEYIDLRDEDPTWYYLDMADYVEETLSQDSDFTDRDNEDVVKDQLEDDGYDGVLAYIEHGENKEYHTAPTVQQRGTVWFDVGHPDKPPLILAKEYWRDSRVLRNSANVALDQRNYAVEPKDDIDDLVLLGVLNSSVTAVIREMEGREQQGQAMNRNELTVGDAENMFIPDVRKFSEEDTALIRNIMACWLGRERDPLDGERETFRMLLDRAVMKATGFGYVESDEEDEDGEEDGNAEVKLEFDESILDEKVKDMQEAVIELLERREQGAGLETEVLIGESKDEEAASDEFTLPGATRISNGGQSKLDSF